MTMKGEKTMNYTMCYTKSLSTNLSVNIDKDGNEYCVGLYNSATKEYTHINFKTIEEACARYLLIAKLLVLGLYSEEDKRQILINGL